MPTAQKQENIKYHLISVKDERCSTRDENDILYKFDLRLRLRDNRDSPRTWLELTLAGSFSVKFVPVYSERVLLRYYMKGCVSLRETSILGESIFIS